MRVLVCCLFIIINISNNGKASLESFAPTTDHMLQADTTRKSDKSCYRPCKFNVKPRRCQYNFKIEPTIQEDGMPAITINGMTPGPPIHVCLNDVIVVEVQNKIPDQDLAIHWHGVDQKGTPYMDGVPMVTQCPIVYGSTYKYAFKASSPGTFFYHSFSVTHHNDGVYGALVVNQPQPMEPHGSLYDYDRSEENTLIVGARFSQLMTGSLEDTRHIKPISLLINGDEEAFKLFVLPGFAYRLRLINAIAIECPIDVSIERHEMMVITTDGKPVKPVIAKHVLLYPGERMDVVVRISQDSGGQWVRVRGMKACEDLSTKGMLLYSGFNYTSMLLEQNNLNIELKQLEAAPVYGQMLKSNKNTPHSDTIKSVLLSIDKNIIKFNDDENDYRYLSDAIPKKVFYPASLSIDNGVVQINGKNFFYPSSPILLKPRDVSDDSICKVGEEKDHVDPQCVLLLEAPIGENLELALVNEGFGSNESYTFHMHGYHMQVVATGQNINSTPFSKKDFQKLDAEGKISRNLHYPPLKDTITVPNKGYTVIRMNIDRGGSWMLECRSCSLSSLPTALLINTPLSTTKFVVDSLPKCGNYRPPDVLLN